MSRLGLLAFIALAISLALPAFGSVASADGIEVRSVTTQNAFPDGVRFRIFMASNAEITLVRLRFRNLGDGGPLTVARAQCTTGTVVDCTATAGQSNNDTLAPGAEIEYYWEIEDAAGQRLQTETSLVTYMDSRFQWEVVHDSNISVYYYFGEPDAVLRTARETIDRFSELEKVTVTGPVKVWVYQTARDLQAAAAGPPSAGHLLGQLSAADTVLVSRDTDFLNVVRHEVAHFVTGYVEKGLIAGLPRWVDEGISTYSQTRLLPGEEQALANAIRRNAIAPISSLDGLYRSSDFGIFYSESGALIDYLIRTYGPDKFATFLHAFRNQLTDGALMEAYGIDQIGLENGYRASVGLPQVAGGNSGGSSGTERLIPTIVPFGSNSGSSAPVETPVTQEPSPTQAEPSDSEGGSSSLPLIAGGALALVVVVGGGAFLMLKRRAAPTPSGS
jgi:hypothetical protein